MQHRAKKPKPDDGDKPSKYKIDILGHELANNLPHWLSPAGKRGAQTDDERRQEIRDRHRARWLAERKKAHNVRRYAKVKAKALSTLARLQTKREWNEEDHPRDEDGKFTDAGGGGGSGGPPQGELWPGKFPPIPEPGKKIESIDEFEKDGVKVSVSTLGNTTDETAAKQNFMKVWNEQVGGIDPGEFKDKFLGGLKGTMTMHHRYNEDKETGEVYTNEIIVDGKLHDDTGKVIGEYTRGIDLVSGKAESAFFRIFNAKTGGGMGKTMLAANVEMYQQMGVDRVETHANIDVGGYAWAKYGYVPSEDSWRGDLRGFISDKLDEMAGGGRPEEWEMMSSDAQEATFQAWRDEHFDEFYDSEVENWRESGAALDEAKAKLAEDFDPKNVDIGNWAWKALQNARAGYPPDGEQPMTVTNDQILANTTIEYERDGEGRNDPVVTIEPFEGLTEDQRYSAEKALTSAFNYRAELDQEDIDPPEHLADNAREFMKDQWESMKDRDKFRYAEDNDLTGEGEGGGEMDEDDAQHIRDLLDSDDPKALWAIADSEHGKDLLIGSDWYGTIDLTDKETMDRFNAYVGRKEAKAA